jgi:hypothetical protein
MALAKSIIFKSENFLFTPNGLNPMLFTKDFLVENKPFKTFFFLKGPSSILLPQATLKENQLPCHCPIIGTGGSRKTSKHRPPARRAH